MQISAFRDPGLAAPAPGIVFFEDFDRGDAPPAPPDPATDAGASQADLIDARRAGFAEGCRHAAEDDAAQRADAVGRALAGITASLVGADAAARQAVDERAAAVARLLLAALAALVPTLCARYGVAEAAALARAVQPALRHEPAVSVRVNPHTSAALQSALDTLDPDLRERLRFIETDAVAEGDVRVEWQHGAAVRDAAALWRSAAAVLEPLGLLDVACPRAPVE